MNILPYGKLNAVTSRKQLDGTVAAHVGIRPEHVTVSPKVASAALVGTVGVTEHLGSNSFYHVDVPDVGVVVASGELSSGIRVGDQVALDFDESQIHLFDWEGNCLTTSNHSN